MKSRKSALPALLVLLSSWPSPALPKVIRLDDVVPDFKPVCSYNAKLCADYEEVSRGIDRLSARGTEVTNDELAQLNGALISLRQGTDAVMWERANKWPPSIDPRSIGKAMALLREKFNGVLVASIPKETAALAGNIFDAEKRVDELVGIADAGPVAEDFQRKLAAVENDAESLWQNVRELQMNADRIGDPVRNQKLTDAGRVIMGLNPLEERAAAMRDRLQGLRRKRSDDASALTANGNRADKSAIDERLKAKRLDKNPFETQVVSDESQRHAGGPSGDPGAAKGALPMSLISKTLLDSHAPPALTGPKVLQPTPTLWQRWFGTLPVFTGKGTEDAYPEETHRVARLRARGLAQTIGDPSGRAKYVFQQTGGTCALASQAEIFAESEGLSPTQEIMKRLEDELFEQARRTNQFTGSPNDPNQRGTKRDPLMGSPGAGGTPDSYIGNMLERPVRKKFLASDDELLAAVKRGKMIIVAVDAEKIWNNDDYAGGGHVINVTGAEVVRETGEVLGYYINDTGSNEGARFVCAKQFLPAWHGQGSLFIEPL